MKSDIAIVQNSQNKMRRMLDATESLANAANWPMAPGCRRPEQDAQQ